MGGPRLGNGSNIVRVITRKYIKMSFSQEIRHVGTRIEDIDLQICAHQRITFLFESEVLVLYSLGPRSTLGKKKKHYTNDTGLPLNLFEKPVDP